MMHAVTGREHLLMRMTENARYLRLIDEHQLFGLGSLAHAE